MFIFSQSKLNWIGDVISAIVIIKIWHTLLIHMSKFIWKSDYNWIIQIKMKRKILYLTDFNFSFFYKDFKILLDRWDLLCKQKKGSLSSYKSKSTIDVDEDITKLQCVSISQTRTKDPTILWKCNLYPITFCTSLLIINGEFMIG